VELGGAIELHAAFRKESRTSLPSVSAALQEIRESQGPFRGPGVPGPLLAIFIRPQ
jgi:hypothetical protein